MRSDGRDDRCVHYDGVIHDVCRAGVAYAAVRGPSVAGTLPYPCFRGREELPCAARRFPTAEENAVRAADLEAALARWSAALDRDECPECGQAIGEYRQVGRCVYADPCGHRLFQGRVAARRSSPGGPRQRSMLGDG